MVAVELKVGILGGITAEALRERRVVAHGRKYNYLNRRTKWQMGYCRKLGLWG